MISSNNASLQKEALLFIKSYYLLLLPKKNRMLSRNNGPAIIK